jgi:heat-inducible transcriptional repressor
MDQRAEIILELIVDHYVTSAEPVSSRTLAKMVDSKMSAATIRNVMADLTEAGLISQPHISAGRVPTDLGYRYYINKFIHPDQAARFKNLTSDAIQKDDNHRRLEDILVDAAEELSSVTSCTGVIISPQPAISRLRNIEYLRLNDKQVLVIIVTQIGMVYNKIVQFRECPDQDILDKISHLFCEFFEGATFTDIRESLVDTLTEQNDIHEEYLAQAIRLGKKSFDINLTSELFVLGRSNMCSFPEFQDQKSLSIVYNILDDKGALLDLLVEVMGNKGIQVRIGNENKYNALEHCSFVASAYGNSDHLLGSIGIIGPTRMNYPRIISELDYSAQKLSYEVDQFLKTS